MKIKIGIKDLARLCNAIEWSEGDAQSANEQIFSLEGTICSLEKQIKDLEGKAKADILYDTKTIGGLYETIDSLQQRIKGYEADCKGDVETIKELRDDVTMLKDAIVAFEREFIGSLEKGAKEACFRPLDPLKVKDLLRSALAGEKITAIKLVRELTGIGLKESKDLVEDVGVQHRPIHDDGGC